MKRKICLACDYPLSTCICYAITKQTSPIPILIIQTAKEAKHPKNTVHLLQLSLSNLTVTTQVKITPDIYQKVKNWHLLFPSRDAINLEESIKNKTVKADDIKGLIVLDGTWREVNKILSNNPWLYNLSCLKLNFSLSQENLYSFRKNTKKQEYRSTLESVAYSLKLLREDFQVCYLYRLLKARKKTYEFYKQNRNKL